MHVSKGQMRRMAAMMLGIIAENCENVLPDRALVLAMIDGTASLDDMFTLMVPDDHFTNEDFHRLASIMPSMPKRDFRKSVTESVNAWMRRMDMSASASALTA